MVHDWKAKLLLKFNVIRQNVLWDTTGGFCRSSIEIKQNHYIMEHIKICWCVRLYECVSWNGWYIKMFKVKWCTEREEKFLQQFSYSEAFLLSSWIMCFKFPLLLGGMRNEGRREKRGFHQDEDDYNVFRNTRKSLKICLKTSFCWFSS